MLQDQFFLAWITIVKSQWGENFAKVSTVPETWPGYHVHHFTALTEFADGRKASCTDEPGYAWLWGLPQRMRKDWSVSPSLVSLCLQTGPSGQDRTIACPPCAYMLCRAMGSGQGCATLMLGLMLVLWGRSGLRLLMRWGQGSAVSPGQGFQ